MLVESTARMCGDVAIPEVKRHMGDTPIADQIVADHVTDLKLVDSRNHFAEPLAHEYVPNERVRARLSVRLCP